MKVRELIEQLQACDPEATVIINDAPVIDDDRNLMEGAMQDVVGLELGFATNGDSYAATESDISFSFRHVPGYTVPSVRLIGYSDEPTNPKQGLNIVGVTTDGNKQQA